ncbi:uncharacterized protein TNIN_63861 [Trichonephila inaurata madagascariensis]|uniref:ribonuclease H n=1 Tax=Trichonephila inaurata madagascariensis TaxID=2747483 RepID=A0A8X7CL56_9ARAC|nr:uncharacterized protein TNIN_63861 [Trichonephila inaurata madagascariensis]
MCKRGFIDFNVDTSTPFSCITPIDSFNFVEFREELLRETSTPKHSSHPELLRQLALEVINDIPDQALIIYTDGSHSDRGRPIFTDGSKSESHVGSAVVSLSTVIADALPISASIYTAELHALRIALEHISLSYSKKFIIYTDSLSALQSIVSLHSSSHPILVDITYTLANHLKKKDVRFCWIPGHAGITGNELADTAARSVTGSSERFPIPHSDLKACFRQKLQIVWQSNWDQQTENKLHSIMPFLAPTMPSSSNRREQMIWTRLRLGHTCLTHRHLLFGEPPPYCEKYNVSLSVKHILCDCPHSNHLRHQLFNSVDFTISSILNNSIDSSLVFKFISIKGFIHYI